MVEESKDFVGFDILDEREEDVRARMKKVQSLIGPDYFEYLCDYREMPEKLRKKCEELAEPNARFENPDKVWDQLFGEGKRKENIYNFRNAI